MDLKGRYGTAKVFTDNIEIEAVEQVVNLLNQEVFKDSKVRIMPDTHAGKGCVIGFTSTFEDKVIPNLVGVDISCGMLCVNLGKININLSDLDKFINDNIPSGMEVNQDKNGLLFVNDLMRLKCYDYLKNTDRILLSLGTLGGGNHFIEVSKNDKDEYFLIIHSGSRNLGKQVATHYQNLAIDSLIKTGKENYSKEVDLKVSELKEQNNQLKIPQVIKDIRKKYNFDISPDLAYLEGENLINYLHDVKICQHYASTNRRLMAIKILDFLNIFDENIEFIETIHNYIDVENKIIRKGAVSAKEGEKLIIPINMRDGSLLCVGKGNDDWNNSAPHGAGRLMSRSKARQSVGMEEYIDSMEGIFSTSITEETKDESPFAYKSMDEIIENTKDTVNILSILKPVYNFKAH